MEYQTPVQDVVQLLPFESTSLFQCSKKGVIWIAHAKILKVSSFITEECRIWRLVSIGSYMPRV